MMKGVYYRPDFPAGVADHLMSFQAALRDEFMAGFSNLKEAMHTEGTPMLDRPDIPGAERSIRTKDEGSRQFLPKLESWMGLTFKYTNPAAQVAWCKDFGEMERYPTACKLLEEYGEDCPILNYSMLAPNSIIMRHTGPENRTGEFIRVHIPLIIPEGDVFFEVNGEEVSWNDIFAFNNQLVHSAHNYTSEYRLVFLIDLLRTRIGLPPGEPYNPKMEQMARPFIRRRKPPANVNRISG